MNNEKIIDDFRKLIFGYTKTEKLFHCDQCKDLFFEEFDKLKSQIQEAQKQSAEENYYKDEWMKNLKVTQDLRVELDGLKQQLSNVNKIIDDCKCYCELCAFGEPHFHGEDYKLISVKELKTSLSKGDVHSQQTKSPNGFNAFSDALANKTADTPLDKAGNDNLPAPKDKKKVKSYIKDIHGSIR